MVLGIVREYDGRLDTDGAATAIEDRVPGGVRVTQYPRELACRHLSRTSNRIQSQIPIPSHRWPLALGVTDEICEVASIRQSLSLPSRKTVPDVPNPSSSRTGTQIAWLLSLAAPVMRNQMIEI